MRILVTGSKGFVGQKLVKELEANGHEVKEFDVALGQDILSREQCVNACKGTDIVFHLAAVLDEKSEMLHKVNVDGTENILEACSKARCKQFVYLSTVGVNAGVKGIVSEESSFEPVTQYEESKAEAEKLVLEFQEMIPITIIRSALVLGPNKYWRQILKYIGKDKPLVGKGEQIWQVIFVDDLVSALIFVLEKKECMGETFIVAEKEKHSLLELFTEARKGLGLNKKSKSVPVWLANLKAKTDSLCGKKGIAIKEHIERLARERNYDTEKIEALGWKAKVGMKEAVHKTLMELDKTNA